MTNFRTVSLDVITEYRLWFGISDIKVLAVERKERFLMKYVNSANGVCQCLVLVLCRSIRVMSIFVSIYLLVIFCYHVSMVK